jgi:hypothetical protein
MGFFYFLFLESMKRLYSNKNFLMLLLLVLTFNGQSQSNPKIESVKDMIDEIIEDIHQAADTIEHIDQINAIYEAGEYAKLKNLIEYYEDLGGSEEQVSKYKVHYSVLGDRLQTRKHNIDIGNIIDLDYQAEVEAEIQDLTTQLETADEKSIYSIQRDCDLLQKIFDINMEQNTVVGEWKEATRAKLIQLNNSVEEKFAELNKPKN